MKNQIPNFFTSLNLFSGCLAIVAALDGRLTDASLFIGVAAVFDFLDGFVARALKAYSDLGKQLDSLADIVSFGVAPAMIFYVFEEKCFGANSISIYLYLPFLIPVFSALRLAKFNIDTRQTSSFIGVPTPANAIFIASIPFIIQYDSTTVAAFFQSSYFLKIFPVVSAYMLVSELPLFALKFKNFKWNDNKSRFIFIFLSVISIIIFRFSGIALSVVLYILISVVNNISDKKKI